MANTATPDQAAGKGLLIAGYIFAFLGGLVGLVIGAHMKWGKITDASGNKVHKYDEASRKRGLVIFIIGLVSMLIWNVIRAGMR